MSEASRRSNLVPGLVLLVLVAFHLRGVLAGGTLFLRDANMVWLPQVDSLVGCIGATSWPLWDPYPGFGRPLLADPRAGVLYPPTWVNLILEPALAYNVLAAFHLLLAGFGTWRLARAWGMSAMASTTAAAALTTGGPLLSLLSMWHHLAGAAWMPWVLLAVGRVLERPDARRVAVAGLVAAVQFLAGSPDYSALTALLAAVFVLLAPPVAGVSRARRWGAVAAAVVLALGLSAAQSWPTAEVALRSARTRRGAESAVWSQHPALLVELVAPLSAVRLPLTAEAQRDLLGSREPWLRSSYMGAVALLLVAAGLLCPHGRRRELLVALAVFVVLALGVHGPAGPLLSLPGVRLLRYPVKALVPAALIWSLLAAAGVDALRAGDRRARRAALLAAALAAAILVAVAAGLRSASPLFATPPPASAGRGLGLSLALLVAAALASFLARRSPRAATLAAGALASLAVADAALRHKDLSPVAPRDLFRRRPAALQWLDTSAAARTYVYDYSIAPAGVDPATLTAPYHLAQAPEGWPVSAALVLGVHEYLNPPTAARWKVAGSFDLDILGFDPVPVDALAAALRTHEGSPAHLRLLQIGAVWNVVALRPAAWWQDLTPAGQSPGLFTSPIRVFRVPDPLPRAYLVDGASVADGARALRLLTEGPFDFRREVLLAEGTPGPPSAAPVGRVEIKQQTCDRVTLDVEAPRAGHVVLVDAYDPGWRASVDGARAPVRRANVGFRAVPVAAGRHTVTMVYRPRGLIYGLVLSLVAAVACVALYARRS